ncbi:sulfite exporter TauE/SafE family protein [Marinobacter sp.]
MKLVPVCRQYKGELGVLAEGEKYQAHDVIPFRVLLRVVIIAAVLVYHTSLDFIQVAVKTCHSTACGLPIAMAGALTNGFTGWQHPELPGFSLGLVYMPALLGIGLTSVFFARYGAGLAHRLDARLLKRFFAVLLIVVGIRFLI